MLKKTQLALFISCISASAFAYQVKANLTIDNKTDIPMQITVKQPNGQPDITQDIPPQHVSRITKSQDESGDPLDNGELYILKLPKDWASSASFTVKGIKDGETYLQGRVNYYSSAQVDSKYSFLDAVTAAKGLSFEQRYTCKSGGYDPTFDNRIVIERDPKNELAPTDFPKLPTANASCQGLKSSTYDSTSYIPVCSDSDSDRFVPRNLGEWTLTHRWVITPNYCGAHVKTCYPTVGVGGTDEDVRRALDKLVGNVWCGTW